jgi:hypothetical protein
VRLRRERVALSPVYYTALQADAAARPAGFSVAAAPGLADADADDATLATALDSLVQSYGSTAPGRMPLNAAATRMLPGAAMAAEAAPAAASAPAATPASPADRWGYLRLTSFSANATEETKRAIISLEVSVSGLLAGSVNGQGSAVLCKGEQPWMQQWPHAHPPLPALSLPPVCAAQGRVWLHPGPA